MSTAYAKPTFQSIQLALSYRYGETAIPASGTANRNFWLNEGVKYIADRLKLKKSTTALVASGEVALPTNFKSLVGDVIYDTNNAPFYIVNEEEYARQSGNIFTITGNFTDGYKLKAKTDGTYTYEYHFYPDTMSSNSDTCIIPDGEAVVCYAYAHLRKSETDPLGDADKNLEEMEVRIAKMNEDMSNNREPGRIQTLN